jgi:hypothetical protein
MIHHLQNYQVLSFFSLSELKHYHLKRLHEFIPIDHRELNSYYNLELEPVPTFPDTEDIEAVKENDDIAIVTNYEEENIVKAKRKHLPGNFKARWSLQEMEIMDNIINAKSGCAEYLRLSSRSFFPIFQNKVYENKAGIKVNIIVFEKVKTNCLRYIENDENTMPI